MKLHVSLDISRDFCATRCDIVSDSNVRYTKCTKDEKCYRNEHKDDGTRRKSMDVQWGNMDEMMVRIGFAGCHWNTHKQYKTGGLYISSFFFLLLGTVKSNVYYCECGSCAPLQLRTFS